jgi:hypothetical protein
MLHAILNGKARHVSLRNEVESQSWRSVFQRYKDLLTAAFWGRDQTVCILLLNSAPFLGALLSESAATSLGR